MSASVAPVQNQKLTVALLCACQALSMTGATVGITVAALSGQMLAENKGLATLPLAFTMLGVMCTTIPASLFMGRVGRRIGFTLGQIIGLAGAALSAWAIVVGSFWLLCGAGFMLGAHNAFWQYLRFAAADCADEAFRPRAISYVMAGGVFAAVAGPEISKLTNEALLPYLFAGSYIAICGLCLIAMAVLQAVRIPRPTAADRSNGGRPLREIARQPAFFVALISSSVGYGMMSLVMTATPIAMIACGYAFDDAAFVIQWHALAMFAPSFVTGTLIRRFGVLPIIMTGALLEAGCMAMNLAGVDIVNFWLALVLLGLGWNFLFVGGTTLLTQSYTPAERSKVQAAHDFTVFGVVTVASFSAGVLQDLIGWSAVNAAIALPVLLAFSAAVWLRVVETRRKSLI
jgi:MFS family permease